MVVLFTFGYEEEVIKIEPARVSANEIIHRFFRS